MSSQDAEIDFTPMFSMFIELILIKKKSDIKQT